MVAAGSRCRLEDMGHQGGESGHLILKSDNEPAIQAVRASVAQRLGGRVSLEGPPKGESQSNGAVEEAGKTIREFARVLKSQVEYYAHVELRADDNITQWLLRWAAMGASRFLVGTDGKIPYERRRGRKCRIPVVRFAEKYGTKGYGHIQSQEISSIVIGTWVYGWVNPEIRMRPWWAREMAPSVPTL